MMLQRLKLWAGRSMSHERTEVNSQLLSLAEELDEFNEWRNGRYGWVNEGGKPGPYLQYIRGLTNPSDRSYDLLADFMDAGTIPSRWNPNEPGGYPEDLSARRTHHAERLRRTRVCFLEYPKDNTEARSRLLEDPKDFRSVLSSLQVDASLKLRLFVVEDLSRAVIEALGHHLKIDPSFFRDHIIDLQWDHLDNKYRVPTRLRKSTLNQSWYTLRYVRVGRFLGSESLEGAVMEAEQFNILRQIKYDNGNAFWDENSLVSLIQSKATLWIQRPAETNDATNSKTSNMCNPSVAVLLLDPSTQAGSPLWQNTRNWTPPPPLRSPPPKDAARQPSDNAFFNFVKLAREPEVFNYLNTNSVLEPNWIPTQILFHIICDHWMTLLDYIQTSLSQIEWEIAFPDDFVEFDVAMAERHKKLLTWHRLLPAFREMIRDMDSLQWVVYNNLNDGCTCQSERCLGIDSRGDSQERRCYVNERNPYQLDISRLGDRMAEYDDQVSRLVRLNKVDGRVKHGLVRLEISRKTRLILRLTAPWMLGPFLAGILTMTSHPISELVPSLRIWAAVAIPITLVLVLGLRFYTT